MLIPDKVGHTGVGVVDSTKARQDGHYCNPDHSDTTNTLLNRQDTCKTTNQSDSSMSLTYLSSRANQNVVFHWPTYKNKIDNQINCLIKKI